MEGESVCVCACVHACMRGERETDRQRERQREREFTCPAEGAASPGNITHTLPLAALRRRSDPASHSLAHTLPTGKPEAS